MAQGALFTGATGLRAFQGQLDVVANNLANLNTISFKSSRVFFSDLVYRDQRSASGSNSNDFGGINPAQVGTGVQIAQISRNFNQGELQSTGEALDFAIRGDGFFVVQDGADRSYYTRAGSFSLDNNGNLVDPATGYLVQRTGAIGNNTEEQFGFQTEGDNRITIPFGTAIPGQATQTVEFNGNLPSSAEPPANEVLLSDSPFLVAGAAADENSFLNDLDNNDTDYVLGDFVTVVGTDADGNSFDFQLPADSSTLGDLRDEINLRLTGAVASLDADGSLRVTGNNAEDSFLSLAIRDDQNNFGFSTFDNHGFSVQTEGTSGDVFENVTQVFDAQGNAHDVNFTFLKTGINSWQVSAALPESDGNLVNPTPYDVTFNENGTFSIASATTGGTDLDLQFSVLSPAQNIILDFNSLTHSATDFGLAQVQDGSPPGVLADITVSGDGLITGVGSNGTFFPIAQIAVASFSNIDGLNNVGDNYFVESSASGLTSIGVAQSGDRGTVVGAQLENSNVDITLEFAQLIVAQRAFSANARTITVAEQVLEELTNLVR
ncbi:MAG: flagellar hook protein FlgE [Planctomycetota bacterium]